MIRSFGIAFAIFLALSVVGLAVIHLTTGDPAILSQSILDGAQREGLTAGAAIDGVLDAAGAVLDAPLSSAAVQDVQLQTFHDEARKSLFAWFSMTMVGGLLVSWGWLAHAYDRLQHYVGPESGRSAGGLWWAGLIACGAVIGASTYFSLKSRGLLALVSGAVVNEGVVLSAGLGLVAYYLATAVSAPSQMRPSVPLATIIFH